MSTARNMQNALTRPSNWDVQRSIVRGVIIGIPGSGKTMILLAASCYGLRCSGRIYFSDTLTTNSSSDYRGFRIPSGDARDKEFLKRGSTIRQGALSGYYPRA